MNKSKNTSQKKSGFKVPKGYFDNFNVNVLNIQKTEVFKVPEDYFNNFEVKLPQETKVIKLKNNVLLYASTLAAIFIIACLVINYNSSSSATENQFSSLENETIELYLEKELEDPEDYINENYILDISNFEEQQLSSEQIIDYLGDDIYEQDYLNDID